MSNEAAKPATKADDNAVATTNEGELDEQMAEVSQSFCFHFLNSQWDRC